MKTNYRVLGTLDGEEEKITDAATFPTIGYLKEVYVHAPYDSISVEQIITDGNETVSKVCLVTIDKDYLLKQ